MLPKHEEMKLSNRVSFTIHGLDKVATSNDMNNWKIAIESIRSGLRVYKFPKLGPDQIIHVEIPKSINVSHAGIKSVVISALVGAGIVPSSKTDKIRLASGDTEEFIVSLGREVTDGQSKDK